jgi:hypothetical protein
MTLRYDHSWGLIEQVPCTQCGVKAGERCRSPKGIAMPPHGKRRADAAAKGVWVPGATRQPT